jgi:hypothetical protein
VVFKVKNALSQPVFMANSRELEERILAMYPAINTDKTLNNDGEQYISIEEANNFTRDLVIKNVIFKNDQYLNGIEHFTNTSVINISGNNLDGVIPLGIEKLSKLRVLNLADNGKLKGSIPQGIWNLPNLEDLIISDNDHLSGAIHNNIRTNSKLKNIRANSLKLSGIIPNSFGNLNNLEYLDLSDNELTGQIPDSIGNLQKLSYLTLNNNHFTGKIPDTITKLVKLNDYNLAYNNLTDISSNVYAFLQGRPSGLMIKNQSYTREANGFAIMDKDYTFKTIPIFEENMIYNSATFNYSITLPDGTSKNITLTSNNGVMVVDKTLLDQEGQYVINADAIANAGHVNGLDGSTYKYKFTVKAPQSITYKVTTEAVNGYIGDKSDVIYGSDHKISFVGKKGTVLEKVYVNGTLINLKDVETLKAKQGIKDKANNPLYTHAYTLKNVIKDTHVKVVYKAKDTSGPSKPGSNGSGNTAKPGTNGGTSKPSTNKPNNKPGSNYYGYNPDGSWIPQTGSELLFNSLIISLIGLLSACLYFNKKE